MILVDEKKLKQAVLNIMADFEYNNWSSIGVCVGKLICLDGESEFQVHINVTKEESELYDNVSSANKCITETT